MVALAEGGGIAIYTRGLHRYSPRKLSSKIFRKLSSTECAGSPIRSCPGERRNTHRSKAVCEAIRLKSDLFKAFNYPNRFSRIWKCKAGSIYKTRIEYQSSRGSRRGSNLGIQRRTVLKRLLRLFTRRKSQHYAPLEAVISSRERSFKPAR